MSQQLMPAHINSSFRNRAHLSLFVAVAEADPDAVVPIVPALADR